MIATANTRDRGVNDMSAALKRRFNIVILPTPQNAGNGNRHRPQARQRAGRQPGAAGRCAGRRGDRESRHDLPRAAHWAKRSTARTSSRRRPACFPRPRQSRCWPTAWRWPATSAPAQVTPHDLAAGLQGAIVRDEEKDRGDLARISDQRAQEARRRLAAAVHGLLGA